MIVMALAMTAAAGCGGGDGDADDDAAASAPTTAGNVATTVPVSSTAGGMTVPPTTLTPPCPHRTGGRLRWPIASGGSSSARTG